ncbi:hypothetical protein WQ57_15330 [Mesobacillus campisalis]|uniref:Na+-translocating membrane potential-generating system MpsC domain-containing protein n=1 Tax=Mesobacillus campisalis TaxID=1408103 RepID=A0A0M2SSR1_9BACI|nr:hypothetical protein WQ57_15330 [Mesobacillus campisalis]
MEKDILEKEIAGFIGRLLRDQFGRGPGGVHCTLSGLFLTVHLTSFLSPMEKSLIERKQDIFVHKTRDLLMEKIINEIKSFTELTLKKEIRDFYYDWNLHLRSGMFLMVLPSSLQNDTAIPPYRNKEKVHHEIIEVSEEAQKTPQKTESILLNKRQLMIVRSGILVSIEKELISLGFDETLIIAKRSLEKRLLDEHRKNFEAYLHSEITDFFVGWDFKKDISYTLFIMNPDRNGT